MDIKSSIKVGLMVIISGVLLFFAWRFLSHSSSSRYSIIAVFKDIKGLVKQTPVRMNGVVIGEVTDVGFMDGTLQPQVTLGIDKPFRDRIPNDSLVRITSGLLITTAQVDIVPGKSLITFKDKDYWINVEQDGAGLLASLSPEADQSLKQLNVMLKTMTPKLTATMDNLQGILKRTDSAMANVEAVTVSARNLAGDPNIRETMRSVMADMKAVSHDARETALSMTTEMRGVVKRNGGKFDELTNGAVDLLQKFADTVDAARGAVTKLTEQVSDPRLQQSLIETVDLAKTTLARFNQIASDIHSISGDPGIQSDLKTTVSSLKETTEDGHKLVQRIGSLVDAIKPGSRPKFGLGHPAVSIDLISRSNSPHFRSDVNLRLPIGAENAFNLGLFDFAEKYKLNAQYETKLHGFGSMRYGIYASKLGVGLNWGDAKKTNFLFDLYNPNSLTLNARSLLKVNDDFSLWLGAENLFKNTTPILGVRLSR